MPQFELTEAGPFLDKRGKPRARGWSRRPLLAYDRAAILSPVHSIKEWDSYTVLSPTHGVSFIVADYGAFGIARAEAVDLVEGDCASDSWVVPFPLGSMSLPASSESGDVRFRDKGKSIDFALLEDGGRILKVDIPGFCRGQGLRGAIVLGARGDAESLTTAGSWRRRGERFAYCRVLPCLSAEGMMQFGGEELAFSKDEAFGTLEWCRGVWPHRSEWIRASVSASVDGHPFALSVAGGDGEDAEGHRTAVFRDGILHKISSATIRNDQRDIPGLWRIVSADGRLDATMAPVAEHGSKDGFLFFSSARLQSYGLFSGRAVLDDGTVLDFKDLPGNIERTKARW
ncbi:MAG TPA: hypothetical protein DIC34_03940 [Treponema sp.]|nr:MAG: hypothetical protein A2Y36_13005 [Treponema sp. GWA1_62_8]OHE66230.1 MAG: hypothetical protein A2001_04855 [Treponema sp. GWC1_61_84]HCM25688.1 hypothetical protein [Treponema sp.]